MKATGIVRNIDDLGRVVVPKEIRRTMRLREGDPLEIYIDADDMVIFKKYSLVGGISPIAEPYAEVLSQNTDQPILITDRDQVIVCAGIPEKGIAGRRITRSLATLLESNTDFTAELEGEHLYPVDGLECEAAVTCSIIGKGNAAGCVIMLMNETGDMPTQTDTALMQVAASFLGRQMEA
jgi:AbrB family transcriptional regulator (stage V sporulation protein T)